MHWVNELELILQEHGELADYGVGVSDAEIERAELALGIGFPECYREYLRKWGWLSFGPMEFLGLGASASSVVTRTMAARATSNLPGNLFVVLEHDGDVLDCVSSRLSNGRDVSVIAWSASSKTEFVRRSSIFSTYVIGAIRDFVA